MTIKRTGMLSVILASYYSKERIEKAYHKLSDIFQKENIPFELVVIDDGSKDNSYELALALEQKYDNVRAYQLSRNYTATYASFAGLSVAKGKCAVLIPDDEQLPYTDIAQMYRIWQSGVQVIFPYRETRDDPWLSMQFSKLYYKIMNLCSCLQYPAGGIDSMFIDREIIDILNKKIHPIHTLHVIEVMRLGFSPVYYGYRRPMGLNEKKVSRWTLKKKIMLAKDTFFSSSNLPIFTINISGFILSILAFCAILFYGYIAIFGNHSFWGIPLPGWTSIVLLLFFCFGLSFFFLGIVAEYIWRIHEEVKGRPGFVIRKKELTPSEKEVKKPALLSIQTFLDSRGNLSVIEQGKGCPFKPVRVFYTYGTDTEVARGEHAHIKCEQFLIALHGSLKVSVDDGRQKQVFTLNSPTRGLYLPPSYWGVQFEHSHDCVLLVLASHEYDASDYIRDYNEFLRFKGVL